MNVRTVLAVAMAWLLVACQSGSTETHAGVDVAGSGGDACPVVDEIGNGSAGASHAIDIALVGLPADVGCDARVRATVFGYDMFVADVSATALLEVVATVPGNGALTLNLDATDFARIEFQSGGPDALGYYVSLFVDVDANGVECEPDLSQDFSASPMAFHNQRDTGVALDITLRNNIDNC